MWVKKTILAMDLYTHGVRDGPSIIPSGLQNKIFHHLTIRRYDLIRDLVLYHEILLRIRTNFQRFVADNGKNPGNVDKIQTLVKTLSEKLPKATYEFEVDFMKQHENYHDWSNSKSWDAIRKDYGISTIDLSEYNIEELYDREVMKEAYLNFEQGDEGYFQSFSSFARQRERNIRKWALDIIAEGSHCVFGGTRKISYKKWWSPDHSLSVLGGTENINYKKWWSPDERTFECWWRHPWEWTIQMDNSMWFMPGFNNKGDTNIRDNANLYSEENATKDLAYRIQKMTHMSTIIGFLVNNILDIEASYGPIDFKDLKQSLQRTHADTDVMIYYEETILTCEKLKKVHSSWKVEYPNAYKNSTCIWKYGFDGNSKDWDVGSMGPHPITVYAQSFRNLNSYCSIMNCIMIDIVELLQHCTVVTICVDLWNPLFGEERVKIDSPTYVFSSPDLPEISNDHKQLTEQIVQCLEKVDIIRKQNRLHANKMRKMFTPSYLFMRRNKSKKNIYCSLRVDGQEFRTNVVDNKNTRKLLAILGDKFRDDITELYTGIQSVIYRFYPMDANDTILQDLGYRTAIAFNKDTQVGTPLSPAHRSPTVRFFICANTPR